MPQSLAATYVHLVFATKDRKPLLRDDLLAPAFSYLGGIARSLDCPALEVGGMPDHVHMLVRQGRQIALSDLMRQMKSRSSLWLADRVPEFKWQGGYGAFSVGNSELTKIRAYIQNQEDHHRVTTFQAEFRKLLMEHALEWDERYVWD